MSNYYIVLAVVSTVSGICAKDVILSEKLSPQALENLSIIPHPNGTTRSLEQMLNTCQTDYGRAYLRRSLETLTSDVALLRKRQEYVARLARAPHVVEDVRNVFYEYAANQTKTHTTACTDRGKEFYFAESLFTKAIAHCKKDMPVSGLVSQLNTNESMLTASFWSHYLFMMLPTMCHIAAHIGLTKLKQCADNACHGHTHTVNNMVYYFILLQHWLPHIASVQAMKTDMVNSAEKIRDMQRELGDSKSFMLHMRSVYNHLKGEYADLLAEHAPLLEQLFGEHGTHPARRCIQKLCNTTWCSSQQRWLHPGTVLAMHAEMRSHADVYAALKEHMGALDAFMNIAKLLITQTKDAPYCLVHFDTSNSIVVQATGLRHHAIDTHAMRPINLSLSVQNPTWVLQGDNGSGKSTLLTALGQAIILSQWGIAPAQQFTCTPIQKIYTHSINRDKIEAGQSHFYYEKANHEAMLQELSQHNLPTIVLLDEPYSCTNAQKGNAHLIELLDALRLKKSAVGIIATHLPGDENNKHVYLRLSPSSHLTHTSNTSTQH